MVMNKEKFKWYNPEFRQRATALAEEIGPVRAAPILGVEPSILRKWIKRKSDGRYMSKGDTPEEKAILLANREIQRLKRENEDLKRANIVLKELASVFSKDRLNSNLGLSLNSTNKKNRSKHESNLPYCRD